MYREFIDNIVEEDLVWFNNMWNVKEVPDNMHLITVLKNYFLL